MSTMKALVLSLIGCITSTQILSVPKNPFSLFTKSHTLYSPVIYTEGKKMYLPGTAFKERFILCSDKDRSNQFFITTARNDVKLAKAFLNDISYDHIVETDQHFFDENPLTYCAQYNNSDKAYAYIKILLAYGVDPNQKNRYGQTALMYATQNADIRLIALLLSHDAIDIFAKDHTGRGALDYTHWTCLKKIFFKAWDDKRERNDRKKE